MTLLPSTMVLLDSTSHSTMALLNYSDFILPWLYFILLHSTLLYHGSNSFHFILFTLPWLYFALLYISLTCLYFTPLLPWLSSTGLYSTLPCMVLLHSSSLYIIYHGSIWLSFTLPYGSTLLYLTLLHSTMALFILLVSTSAYYGCT